MTAERTMVRNLPAICAFGRYELLGRLAVGGMAEIYLARETSAVQGAGSRHLVIKRVLAHVADDETFQTMFFDEARLAMRLNHPGIVHLYEFGEEQGSWFLAMEWIDGIALGKLIRKAREAGGVPAPIAVKICAQVADALHYAHNLKDEVGDPLGIIHRDVSPQNVMVSFEGSVKLLDFGIAKASFQHTKTQDGQVKGKFAYMSPQQCLGEPMDGRADVFALGVVLYESLTGRPLYHRKTQYETMRAVIEEPVPSIRKYRPDLPESLDAIVQKALQKKQEDRQESAGALQFELEHWLATQREVVQAPRIAEYLQGIFGEEIQRGPAVDSTPFGQSFQLLDRPSGVSIAPPAPESIPAGIEAPQLAEVGALSLEAEAAKPSKKGLWIGLAAALLLLLVAGGAGAWWLTQQAATAAANLPSLPTALPGALPPGQLPTTPPTTPEVQAPEVEAPEVPVAMGAMITFRSEPAGATVRIGDREVPGTTPTALGDFPVGTYAVVMQRDGYAEWTEEVEVVAGRPLEVEARLRRPVGDRPRNTVREPRVVAEAPPAASPGRLSINTRPWSKVYVGERLLGTTPIGGAEVPSGTVRLRIVDRDGAEHTRSVRVDSGGEERVFYDLTGIE
ncbi:MAG: serine/threonine protein kinase [Sandaracinus sp.]|nr:serine/threonine protein kinase [Sandaracinus sp.]